MGIFIAYRFPIWIERKAHIGYSGAIAEKSKKQMVSLSVLGKSSVADMSKQHEAQQINISMDMLDAVLTRQRIGVGEICSRAAMT